MVREFEERAEKMGRRPMFKESLRFAEALGVELNLEHPRPFSQQETAKVSSMEARRVS